MKKVLFFTFALLGISSSLLATEDPLAGVHRSLKDEAFVVESDEDGGSNALNRISGDIDLGFSGADQSYNSSDHYRPGPFARSEIADKKDQTY